MPLRKTHVKKIRAPETNLITLKRIAGA